MMNLVRDRANLPPVNRLIRTKESPIGNEGTAIHLMDRMKGKNNFSFKNKRWKTHCALMHHGDIRTDNLSLEVSGLCFSLW